MRDPKRLLEKPVFFQPLDHNALKLKQMMNIIVT